jgi:hypothetical protein
MDTIRTTIKKLICEDSNWISRMTSYPKQASNINVDTFNKYYHDLKSTFEEIEDTERAYSIITSKDTYKIIKELLQTQGIRTVHPAWFFIHQEKFKEDKIIFEETIENEIDIIKVNLPKNTKQEIRNKIQKLETLNIYYALLTNPKIEKCFIDKRSLFIENYPEFSELWKYLFFPRVEMKQESTNCRIDLTYDFNNIIKDINIEINEPHHNKKKDTGRETEIFCRSGNRIIQYYINKSKGTGDISKLLQQIYFRITVGIFMKNMYAGLTYNAFIMNIIPNLSHALFFSNLKKLSKTLKLSWKTFVKMCQDIGIVIDKEFINIFITNSQYMKNEEKIKEKLNKHFYNLSSFELNKKLLGSKTLLTESGYDYYLIRLPDSEESEEIKDIYSNYRQAYDEVMTVLLQDRDIEIEMYNSQLERERQEMTELIEELNKYRQIGANLVSKYAKRSHLNIKK